MKNWIENQPKYFNYYTRKLDRSTKLHFREVTTKDELYAKYTKDMQEKEH
jgi:hypothetical protein